jgi:hypothetical protein
MAGISREFLSITLVLARYLYGEGSSFSRCKVNISPRQHFVCVEAVPGEVSEWIVGELYIGYMLLIRNG